LRDDQPREKVRSIILSTLLFSSFLCWVFVIRSSAHLGYMIAAVQQFSNVKAPATATAPAASDIEAAVNSELKEEELHVQTERKEAVAASMKLLVLMVIYFR
jgi:hypothetical protein